MIYKRIKDTLTDFYINELPNMAKGISERVFARMDSYDAEHPGESSYRLKARLYEAIADEITPVIFDDIPYFFETGALLAFSDGKFNRGGLIHANGWLYLRNEHIFKDADPHAYEIYQRNGAARLYAQTGTYVDIMHVGLPMKKIFKVGLEGIYDECLATLKKCETDEEREFIECAISGVLALRKIMLKLADAANKRGLGRLADIAGRIPWNPPSTMHEGLCTLAFIRKALGALEGVGFNSFGRVDLLLLPLYDSDIKRGVSEQSLLDEVTRFLLIWDCALDKREPMQHNYEYELENTLTLGGKDANGNPVWNGVTRLFLTAREQHDLLYPKMMLRYSATSPREYLYAIGAPLLKGKSFSLYANDDSIIPALIKAGVDAADANDYVIGGCWDALTPDTANKFSGEYLNILTPLEWGVHLQYGDMERNELAFSTFDDAASFEEVYDRYLSSVERLLWRKAEPMSVGSRLWHKVNPLPTLSALMEPCLPKKRDITRGGKYNRECVYFCGFAEVVDSLLAIKALCFSEPAVCTLGELLAECRRNWQNEVLRQRAISAPSYGDGSEESSRLAGRLFDDLYRISRGLPTAYGGEFRIGYNQYTEIIWWGKATKATPNGRRDGDFLSQGISPSRLIRSTSAIDVLDSMRYIDTTKCAGNASVTVTLPATGLDADRLSSFFRAVSASGIQSLQPNVVNREELLAAQSDPEHYGHIIVRVCGFSAPFVLLSPTYQEEILSRLSSEY